MVERYVFIKLKDQYSNAEGRKEVIERTLKDLSGLAGITKLIVGGPADESAERAWDVSIVAVFDSYDQVEPYLKDPAHRAYVDEFLVPRMEMVKHWNFEVTVAEGAA